MRRPAVRSDAKLSEVFFGDDGMNGAGHCSAARGWAKRGGASLSVALPGVAQLSEVSFGKGTELGRCNMNGALRGRAGQCRATHRDASLRKAKCFLVPSHNKAYAALN